MALAINEDLKIGNTGISIGNIFRFYGEREIGVTKNGEKIYEAIYENITLASHLLDVSDLKIDTLFDIEGIVHSEKYKQYKKVNVYQNSSDYVVLKYSESVGRIDCDFTTGYDIMTRLTLKYTKK